MEKINNIIRFNDLIDFEEYIEKQKLLTKLGKGMEGSCYLSSKDNYAYKIIESNFFNYTNNQYKIDEIITTKDINLNYFAIPEELYTISKRLIGYKTKYISSDLFDYYNLSKNYENMYKIDYKLLIKAYDKIKEEVKKISEERIKIYDLGCNLMFTGEDLIAIDTCSYTRVSSDPFDINCYSLDQSIKDIFNSWIEFNPNIDKDEIEFIDQNQDLKTYLDNITALTKKVKKKILI